MTHNSKPYKMYELEDLLGEYTDIAQETYSIQKKLLKQGFCFLIKYSEILQNNQSKYISTQSIIDSISIRYKKNNINLRNYNNRNKIILYPDETYSFQIYYCDSLLSEGFILRGNVNCDCLIKNEIKKLGVFDKIKLLSFGYIRIKIKVIEFGELRINDEEYSNITNTYSFLIKSFSALKNEWNDYCNRHLIKKRLNLLENFGLNENMFLQMNFFDFDFKEIISLKYLYDNFWYINDNNFLLFKAHKYGKKEYDQWQDLKNGILENFCLIDTFTKYSFFKIIMLILRGKNV